MKATVIIERGADGTYSAYIHSSNIPFGVLGDGATPQEAIEDFKASLEDMRQSYKEDGEVFPKIDFEFKYDVPSFLQLYAFAFSLAGLERITGINQKQLGHYISGFRVPSDRTIRKMEQKIQSFAKELEAVRFV